MPISKINALSGRIGIEILHHYLEGLADLAKILDGDEWNLNDKSPSILGHVKRQI